MILSLLQSLFWSVAGWLLRLRYRVRVEGGEQLRDLRGPTLVMPNHPGYIDPPLVLSHVRIPGGIRPVVFEGMYRRPALYPLMRLVNALEVPDLSEHSHGAREQTLTMIDTIVAGIGRGESFLIYPSGRTQRREREQLGAARAAAEIIERCPQANLVLVRTRGVWGSMFSFARTGAPPHLARCVWRACAWMLASLLFFAPRRQITITIERLDRKALPGQGREQLNPFLEGWYNRGGPEPPAFVPYHHLWGPRTYLFPDLTKTVDVDPGEVPPATIQAVNELIEEHLGRPLGDEDKQPETLLDEIGLDSLDRMDIALKIEDRFGFRSDRVADTVGELWALAAGQLPNQGDAEPPIAAAWQRGPSTTDPVAILGETLPEAFVRRALQHPDDVAVADRLSGVLTYRRLLVGTRLMGRRLAELEGDAIGVLLPASVAADLVFFALHLVGKLPVMLNWTTGPGNLAHAVDVLHVRKVVTSRKLIDRLGIQIPGAEYVFLEDLRTKVGKMEAMLALLTSYLVPNRFLHNLPRPHRDKPAVVLFTSGSENAPKAVPLSHGNLIQNVRAGLAVLNASRADSMLGFLPPFHSFGLTGNILVPLLAGFPVAHHPDPTDATGLVRAVAAYGTTLLVATPTFLSYMFGIAAPDELRSLRLIIAGAEKCPESVFAKARELVPQATILEGYGITECSPVVSGNRPGRIKPGTVGPPLDGVEVCVVHPESRQPLPSNHVGLLLVRGPSIFHGYLNYDGPDPFVDVGGKKWYVTGDLVQLDDEGFIHFSGRLKRFLKVGGEMVSLPALEEPISALYPPTENGPQVAVEGVETPGGRWIVLFSTADIPLRQANAILTEAGFRGVMRIDEVLHADAIPVLGTGKTDYKALRRLVVERAPGATAKT